jgi:hypothetical protein
MNEHHISTLLHEYDPVLNRGCAKCNRANSACNTEPAVVNERFTTNNGPDCTPTRCCRKVRDICDICLALRAG